MEQADPGLGGGGAGRERAVIAEHHQRLAAEVGHQPLALVEVQGDALVVVIGQVRRHDQGVLRQRQEALGLGRDGDALVGVHMHDEARVLAGAVDRRVDHIARGVDAVGALHHDVTVKIDLHQGRGGDLLEIQAERVDQEVMLRARHAGGDMGEDQVVPLLQGHQPVERREVDPRAPLPLAHLALQ